MIYIDPPYNTGKEFVYNDTFDFSDEKLKNMLGLTDTEIKRLHSINGRSSHSAWLTFMYPRLKLARTLLKDSGVMFISIDDNEQANLKLLCDEIFGEGNFVAEFIVIRSEGGGLAKQAVIGHDYLLAYAKNISQFVPLGKPKDIRGKVVKINNEYYWIETDWLRKEFGKYGTCYYEEITKWHGQSKKDEIDRGVSNGNYTLIAKNNKHIVGRYRKIADDTSKFYTVMKHLNKTGNDDLSILRMQELFDFPKPISLIKELVFGATVHNKSSLILDFFAGSGTTAHAVMQLNAEDGGNRRWILCNIDEPTPADSEARKAGYTTIDAITVERIKRAAEHIGDASGFKRYSVKEPAEQTLNKIEAFDPEQNVLIPDDMVAAMGGAEVILYTWMVADGYKLDSTMQEKMIAGYTAYYDTNAMVYLIHQGWGKEQTKTLLNLIGTNQLNVRTIICYGYSFTLESMRELEINVQQSLNNQVVIEKRY